MSTERIQNICKQFIICPPTLELCSATCCFRVGSLAELRPFVVYKHVKKHLMFSEQWPSGSLNGYAYYHRVDQVNDGDMNATHTTGFSEKDAFWYE